MPSNSILDELAYDSETSCIAMGDEKCAFVAKAKQHVKKPVS
jgi:predicted hydrocarbon binding protein